MGLNWSDPHIVTTKAEQQQFMVVKAPLLRTNVVSVDELWNIWRQYKDELKADNFRTSKYAGRWSIEYWHKLTGTSQMKTNVDGKYVENWRKELDEKCNKWKNKIYVLRDRINMQNMEDLTATELNLVEKNNNVTSAGIDNDDADVNNEDYSIQSSQNNGKSNPKSPEW